MGETKTLHFGINGNFITQFSRDRFWNENAQKHAHEILDTCVSEDGTEMNDEYKVGILTGKYHLVGSTGDKKGIYLTEDKTEFNKSEKEYDWMMTGEWAKIKKLKDLYDNRLDVDKCTDWVSEGRCMPSGMLSPEGYWFPVPHMGHQDLEYDIREYYEKVMERSFNVDFRPENLWDVGWVKVTDGAILLLGFHQITAAQKRVLVNSGEDLHFYDLGYGKLNSKNPKAEIAKGIEKYNSQSRRLRFSDTKLETEIVEKERLNDMFVTQNEDIMKDLKHRGAKNIKVIEHKECGVVYCTEYIVDGDNQS